MGGSNGASFTVAGHGVGHRHVINQIPCSFITDPSVEAETCRLQLMEAHEKEELLPGERDKYKVFPPLSCPLSCISIKYTSKHT